MAQTRRRRRKHRGTQGGSIDRRGRTARPRSRQEARARAKQQLSQKRDLPPTWRGAVNRALLGAALFLVLLLVLFKQPASQAVVLATIMLAIYIPLGHAIDRIFYSRRQAARRKG